jgi:hypothetical protein
MEPTPEKITTTVRIPPDLLRQVRIKAATVGLNSVQAAVLTALREWVAPDEQPKPAAGEE